MIILTKRPHPRYVIAGGYKLHAKMPTHVYSSYIRHGMFSGHRWRVGHVPSWPVARPNKWDVGKFSQFFWAVMKMGWSSCPSKKPRPMFYHCAMQPNWISIRPCF